MAFVLIKELDFGDMLFYAFSFNFFCFLYFFFCFLNSQFLTPERMSSPICLYFFFALFLFCFVLLLLYFFPFKAPPPLPLSPTVCSQTDESQ